MDDKIRIGIIGCSTIALNSTIPAILKSTNCKLSFVGSRSNKKAKDTAQKFECEKYGSYDDVLHNSNVDAVYISTPIGTHEEWVIKSAQNKKHVLCEKSSTTSYSSAKKMIQVCKANNVRLMEGFMYRFHPSHKKVQEFINKGTIGKIFSFSSKYGFPPISKDNIRYDKLLGGGILNDAGCYPINASRMLFGCEPEGILCSLIIDKEKQVDTKATIFMDFSDGKHSLNSVGYDLFYQSVYSLWGSNGSISLTRAYNVSPDMHVTLDVDANDFQEKISIDAVNHFKIMISSFCDEIHNANLQQYNFEDDLLNQARVMEAARISNNEKRYVRIDEVK